MIAPVRVNSVAFSPESRVVAARCTNGQILLVHVKSAQIADTLEVAKVEMKSLPLGLVFSSDGDLLAADNPAEILIWNLQGWRKKLEKYEHLSPERLEALWPDLARWVSEDDDYFEVPTVNQLLSIPEQAVSLLKAKLQPVPLPDEAEIKRRVNNLDHADFQVREQATQALHKLDWLAKPALQEAISQKPTLETWRRIEWLLAKMTSESSPEHKRQYRAVRILGMIDSGPAREVLRRLTTGASAAYLTNLAKEEMERMKERDSKSKKK